jgi:hypothetical protein
MNLSLISSTKYLKTTSFTVPQRIRPEAEAEEMLYECLPYLPLIQDVSGVRFSLRSPATKLFEVVLSLSERWDWIKLV